ncbi:MAG: SH3 domain-containing protein, partial [Chloroflexota bacterium]
IVSQITPETATNLQISKLTATVNLNVRTGPDTKYDRLGQLTSGTVAEIVGQNEDGSWWQIRYPENSDLVGWVSANSEYGLSENADVVPIVATPTTPLATPVPTSSDEFMTNQQPFSSERFRLRGNYPVTWQLQENDVTFTIKSPELLERNRSSGGELIVGLGDLKRPDGSLQAEWDLILKAFPEVTFSVPDVTTFGGKEAFQAIFTDPRDGSHGWFILTRHNNQLYIIIAQAFGESWGNYEDLFDEFLATFVFMS